MKITDLQLEDYGIYKNESVQPSQDQLIVVMGENESGKTTLLNFIRDMLFGFKRGNWKGRKGNMAFVRSNGGKYRVFRDGKDSYFTDSKNEKSSEELPQVWWHGLTRSMYEHIFGLFRGIRYIANPAAKYIVQYHFQNCEMGIGFLHECIYRAAYHSKFTGRLCGCHHQSSTSLCGQQFCTCGRQCIGRSIEHSAGMYQGTQRWCRRIWSAGSGFYVPAHFD